MALGAPLTALLNMAPIPVNMRMCHKAPTAQKHGFSLESELGLAFLVQPEPPKRSLIIKSKFEMRKKKQLAGPQSGSFTARLGN